MSYTVSQSAEQTKLAISLQRKCDVDTIRLVEITAHSKMIFSTESYPLAYAVDFGPDSSIVEGRTLRVSTLYRLKILDREKNDIVTIKCVIAADYLLQDGFVPSAEQIKAFQGGPAIHNCWPYFRECAQATVSKMNYPPLTLPFLWIVSAPSELDKAPKQVSAPRAKIARHAKAPEELVQKTSDRD